MRIRGSRASWQWRIDSTSPIRALQTKNFSIPKEPSSENPDSELPSSGFSANLPDSFDFVVTRCEGLDLLAKAVRDVLEGSRVALMGGSREFGVPLIRRRVVRRGKKAVWLQNKIRAIQTDQVKEEEDGTLINGMEEEEEAVVKISSGLRSTRRRLPKRIGESMIGTWKRSKRIRSSLVTEATLD